MAEEWSTARVAEQFRCEVQQAFERENAAFRAEEAADIEKVKRERAAEFEDLVKRAPHLAEARDSLFWEIYSGSDIQIENNAVKVVLPNGFAIYSDFIEMFEGTSVGWSYANVGAEIVEGEPRVIIELILIDYWDDDRAAKRLVDKEAERHESAEALLRHIQKARYTFAADNKSPIDGLYAIEHWIEQFFRQEKS